MLKELITLHDGQNCGKCRPVGLIIDFLSWLSGVRCRKGYSRPSSILYVLLRAPRFYSLQSKKLPRTNAPSRILRKVAIGRDSISRSYISLYRTVNFARDSSLFLGCLNAISRTNRLIVLLGHGLRQSLSSTILGYLLMDVSLLPRASRSTFG